MHDNTVYCMSFNSYIIYSFQVDEDKWARHSKCPHCNTALTIINGYLTAVGGRNKREQTTNKVLSLKGGRWEEEVPPMVIARWRHAVISDGHNVVVAGGWGESSVEVFTGSSWFSVAGLPDDLPDITATLCGDLLYVMDWDGRTYSSSLTSLLSTQAKDTATPATHSIWRPLKIAPISASTLSTIDSQVFAVGEWREGTPIANVYRLFNGQWTRIGYTNTAKTYPIVAALPGNRMLVVGSFSFSQRVAVELVELC